MWEEIQETNGIDKHMKATNLKSTFVHCLKINFKLIKI